MTKRQQQHVKDRGDKNSRATIGARATVHGAISIVNAIATKKGATVGIDLEVSAEVKTSTGTGIIVARSEDRSLSSRLIRNTIRHMVPKNRLDACRVEVSISSQIPVGFGLKSSSAISSAVSLACAHAFALRKSDQQILLAGIDASIASKVSITGAYDDACSCYYGGFNITDNAGRRLIRRSKAPESMNAVIFIPKKRRRGNVKKLKILATTFEEAWSMAKRSDHWGAMTINGLAAAAVLGSDPGLIPNLMEKGAVAASVSGNGPAIAAVADASSTQRIKNVFASAMEGRTIVSALSNKKSEAHGIAV